MHKRSAVKQVSLGMIPLTGNAVALNKDLILKDNFDEDSRYSSDMPLDEDGMFTYPLETPYKQMFVYSMFCTEGRLKLRVNLQDYILEKNDLIIIFPGFIIDSGKAVPGSKAAAIAFTESTFLQDDNGASLKVIRQNMLHPQQVSLRPEQMDMLIPLYKLMRRICTSKDFAFKYDAINGALRLVASGIAKWITDNGIKEQDADSQNRGEHLFMNFLQEVQVHCAKERKISYYARKFCISPKYFAKLIYDASGRHAGEWIRDYVILEAKAMLRTGDYTVQQVSDALNFPNSSFFGKYFKSAVGCSPRRYAITAK